MCTSNAIHIDQICIDAFILLTSYFMLKSHLFLFILQGFDSEKIVATQGMIQMFATHCYMNSFPQKYKR